MRIAKSARMRGILGASLVALIVPGTSIAERASAQLAGIGSSSVEGIDASSTDAIDGSSTDAIDGSSILGIDASSILGIDASSTDAIDGSSTDAIDGSSILGIDASSILGIDASSTDGIDASSTEGIDASSAEGIDASSTEVLAGPVQSIDLNAGTFVAIGQTVVLAGADLASLRVGDFVTVSGTVAGAGLINASAVLVSPDIYVPGATEVFVTGIPSSIDSLRGTAQIGELNVDYTLTLGDSRSDGFGAAVKIIGTQPALGGTMLGQRVIDRTDLFLGGKSLR